MVACACRMKEKFAKYWENFSNVNYLLHVAIVLDPRYKLKYVNFVLSKYMKQVKLTQKLFWLINFQSIYEWYNDFYLSKLGNEINTPSRSRRIDDNDSDDIDDTFEKKLEDE